ncbi:MAG: endonuclease MutS2 [Bacilli bacterium]|nr:endonuclease MutS2 [Bacilli bacterium]
MYDSYLKLELNIILEKLSGFALTSFAKQRILSLEVSTDYYRIEEDLQITDEALRIITHIGRCPMDFIHNNYASIEKAYKGGVLTCEELYRISSQTQGIMKIKGFLGALDMQNIEHFRYFVDSLYPCKALSNRIDRCINSSFEVMDEASSELKRIRKEIRSKENEIRRKMESYIKSESNYLSENIITMRNDRLVIPVKASYKYNIDGIIHDESSSQQTVFIEPSAVVLLNAKVASLKQEEKEEVERILRELSGMVKQDYDSLLTNMKMLEEIDFMFSKGAYGYEINGKVAELSHDLVISLHGARHPLLDPQKVIANDFYLGDNNPRIYLITGPNTGGKTVALKTVGLLVLMNQCGLAIPTNFDSKLGIFESFFVDIGDEQSIEKSLSTFSSHMTKLVDFVDQCDSRSLIIVDEIGGGTDPKEGEALAMAIIEHFYKRGCTVLASTHYSNLKTYAIEKGYITSSSMIFNHELLKPTYKLQSGMSGRSYAFEIALNLGLRKDVIENAITLKNEYSSKTDLLLEQLDRKKEEIFQKEQELELLKLQLEENIKQNEKKKQELVDKEEKLKEQAASMIDDMVLDAMQEVDELLKDIKARDIKDVKMHEAINIKSKLKKINEVDEEDEESSLVFNVGDSVKVKSLNKTGKVTRVSKDHCFVSLNGMNIKVKSNDLMPFALQEEKKEKKKSTGGSMKYVAMELNIIGMHVDESLILVDKYLDSCALVHHKSVRIIHGHGTGALRGAVHEYLKKCKYVESFRLGGPGEGGVGATVVTLK